MKSAPRTGPVHGGAGENADGQSMYVYFYTSEYACLWNRYSICVENMQCA
jgi:hypothetical protein